MSTTTILLTNKYFFVFLFMYILYTIIKHLMKFPYVKKDQNDLDFLRTLDNFIIKNIYYEIFIFCIYIFCYFGLFLVFRINILGYKFTISTLGWDGFNLEYFLNIFCYASCIIFYIKIINLLFYPTIIKLHYYFYQFEWYENFKNYLHMNQDILSSNFLFLRQEMVKYTFEKDFLIEIHKDDLRTHEIMKFRHKTKAILLYELNRSIEIWNFINNNKILWYFIKFIDIIFAKIPNLSRTLHYFPYLLLITVLLSDLYTGTLYYTFYALLVYFIMIWFQKVRYFFNVKDPIEHSITTYFYKNDVSYEIIKKILDDDILKTKLIKNNVGEDTISVLFNKEELIEYFLNNFVVYHVRYPKRIANNKYLNNETKRSLIIWFLFAGVIYYCFNISKYVIIVFNVNLNIWLTFSILVILLFIIEKKIIYDTEIKSEEISPVFGERKLYKTLFILLFLFIAILMLFIMFKNKLTMEPNEVLLEIKDCIKITEYFTVDQKTTNIKT